jgi:hypothetical protein
MDGENMRFLFSSTSPNTATDGRYEPYQLPLFSRNWFIFYFEQRKYCFQRFMITSHIQNFRCLAGRLGKITFYSGIEMCVKILEETA